MAVSKFVLFGFEERVYSYAPTGWPTEDWAKVVDKDIWQGNVSHEVQLNLVLSCRNLRIL